MPPKYLLKQATVFLPQRWQHLLHTVWHEGTAGVEVMAFAGSAWIALDGSDDGTSTENVWGYRAFVTIHRRCALMLHCTLSKADNSRLDLSVSCTGSSLPDRAETPSQQGSRPPIDKRVGLNLGRTHPHGERASC